MNTEHGEFPDQDEFVLRSGTISRSRVWAAIAAIYIVAAIATYLRFDMNLDASARALVIAAPALATAYGAWRGVRRSDRTLANWPGGEDAYRAAFAAWHGRVRERKRTEWRSVQSSGRLQYLWRKAPVYVLILTPLILAVLDLLAPEGLVPGRVLPAAPRSLLWFGAALGCAAILSVPLTLWEWTRAEQAWAAVGSDSPAV